MPSLPRHRAAFVLLLAAAVAAFVAFPPDVLAATYVTDCTSAIDIATCEALAERLEVAVTELETANGSLAAIETNTSGGGVISGTVALSAADRERSDLSWYAGWATVGLLLVLLVAPGWSRAWRWGRD